MPTDVSRMEQSLAVEVKTADGQIKDARYIVCTADRQIEFVPNKLYLYLLNHGIIKGDTFKIRVLFGKKTKSKIDY